MGLAGGNLAKVRPAMASSTTNSACDGVPLSGDLNGDEGVFAWADNLAADLLSTGPNQFLVRADGGVMFNTNTLPNGNSDLVIRARPSSGDPDVDLVMETRNGRRTFIYTRAFDGALWIEPGNLDSGANRLFVGGGSGGPATLSNGGTWTNASSRLVKHAFEAIDSEAVLDRLLTLDISRWKYRGSGEGSHIGPMAEDFHAAFATGNSDRQIATVDADGVALAAIQGLHARQQRELSELKAENADLQARLAALSARVEALLTREPDHE